jgi:dihydrofolate synthase/folylpolyglutamate synthase
MSAYLEALNRLCQPVRRGDYPATLRPMHDLMAVLGSPHKDLRAVVVTGSTGKGTTCHQIARLLRGSGLNVGLYTSPHLHSFRERFVFNDQIISEADFVAGAEVVAEAARRLGHSYSTFEQATALALWWFARQKPDVVVLEIGLGGRWDAVNVVDNSLAVFTRIESEHAAMLGGSLKTVAWHKAGIIKPGGHAVTVKQDTEVFMVLNAEARQKLARLHLTGGRNLPHDKSEGLLPLAAWQNLLERGIIPRRSFQTGIQFGTLPGRLEQVNLNGNRVLIDGGHTPEAARYLLTEITRLTGSMTSPVRLIIGLLEDKDARAYLQTFDSPRFNIVLTSAPGHRAAAPEMLLARYPFCYSMVQIEPDLNRALEQAYTAPESLVVVAGSLRTAAIARETYGLLPSAALDEARATRSLFDGSAYLSKLPATVRTT